MDTPERRLPTIDAPILVVRGEHDALTTVEWARRCADLAPRGEFVEIAGAAHAAHVSHPERVAELVDSLLAERDDQVGEVVGRVTIGTCPAAGMTTSLASTSASRQTCPRTGGTTRSRSPQTSSVGAMMRGRSARMSALETCRPPRTTFLGPVRSASAVSRARNVGRLRASVTRSGHTYVVDGLGSTPGGAIRTRRRTRSGRDAATRAERRPPSE
jgi:hypothetical protein